MKVVIIIPTYNERENIGSLINALRGAIKLRGYSILVVDDESPDGTGGVVNSEMKRWKNLELLTGEKEGIGRALQRGIDHAVKNLGAEIIVQMDADFSHDPNDVPRLLAEIENGYDLVIGSRYIKGGAVPPDWAFQRKILSWGGNLLVRLLTGIWGVREFTTNFRAFTTNFYQKMNQDNFAFADNTFLPAFVVEAHRCDAKIKEVPIVFHNRKKGKSKIEVAKYVPSLLKYLCTLK
jgi:dolichol-phosphate mannosyltransferase